MTSFCILLVSSSYIKPKNSRFSVLRSSAITLGKEEDTLLLLRHEHQLCTKKQTLIPSERGIIHRFRTIFLSLLYLFCSPDYLLIILIISLIELKL